MSITEEIEIIISDLIKQQPTPLKCKITHIYEDNNYVDVETDMGELKHIYTVGGTPHKNKTALLVFIKEDDMVVIA